MDIFNEFNFGRLIRIFIPGLSLLVGLLMAGDAVAALAGSNRSVFAVIADHEVLSSAAALPASIILGLFSNMLFYAYLKDRLVRRSFNQRCGAIAGEELALLGKVLADCSQKKVISTEQAQKLHPYLDCAYLLLPNLPVDKLIFTLENHAPYLDFQLNTLLVSVVCYCSGMLWWAVRFFSCVPLWTWLSVILAASLTVVGVSVLCLRCARKNYDRLQMNLLSLLSGTYRNGFANDARRREEES